jgi:hypothetical protein
MYLSFSRPTYQAQGSIPQDAGVSSTTGTLIYPILKALDMANPNRIIGFGWKPLYAGVRRNQLANHRESGAVAETMQLPFYHGYFPADQ